MSDDDVAAVDEAMHFLEGQATARWGFVRGNNSAVDRWLNAWPRIKAIAERGQSLLAELAEHKQAREQLAERLANSLNEQTNAKAELAELRGKLAEAIEMNDLILVERNSRVDELTAERDKAWDNIESLRGKLAEPENQT